MSSPLVPNHRPIRLAVNNLVKDFDGFSALNGVSFGIMEGEIFGLLGPNGAGKSTCMKIICGLLSPTRGEVVVDGYNVIHNILLSKSKIGYLPEYPALFEHITGREFLGIIGRFRDINGSEIQNRIDRLDKVLDLEGKMDDLMGTYSKGMRQKIAFASTIIHDPPILVLDEPTSGLDPRFGRYVREIIKEFGARGKTILLSTHITDIASELCHRIAIINRGQIVITGSVADVLAKTQSGTLEEAFINAVGGRIWTGSIFTH